MSFFENYGNDFKLHYRNYTYSLKNKNILHIHPHYEMIIVPSHHSHEHMINGHSFATDEPSVAICAPFSMHHANFNQGDHVERIVFYFGDTMMTEHPSEFKAFDAYKTHMFFWSPLPEETIKELRPIFDMLAKSYETNDIITQKMLFLIVLNKIFALDKNKFITITKAKTGNIHNVIRYMVEHFHENITAENVAEHFFISRSKLNKDFKQYTGISFHKLLNELKLSKAQYLLQQGNVDIKDISSNIGFESETYFFAFFKKMTGITPLQYAKKQGYHSTNKSK